MHQVSCFEFSIGISFFRPSNFLLEKDLRVSIDIVSSQLYVCHILVSKKCQLQAGTIHPRPLA